MIARAEPYCLFLDELNACSTEVQRSFYSLIHERRIGDYVMPAGSVVIGAGNRAQDSAIVRPLSSALVNRMFHVHLSVSVRDWLEWALASEIHPWVFEYIELRPDHLTAKPPGHEEPFSTPRSWHMMSDALREYGDGIGDRELSTLAFGCLSPHHAGQFRAFVKQRKNGIRITAILRGSERWPDRPEDRDLLYFLSQSFRAHLAKDLPADHDQLTAAQKQVSHRAKALMKELAAISLEMAQLVIADDGDSDPPPSWFLVELVRDLPRLAAK